MPRSMIPLVGRKAELATALAAIGRSDAAAGGSVLVVDGDAGIGKTRLLTELSDRARTAGVRTLIGHCVDLGEAPPPYLPITEAFSRLAREEPTVVDDLLRHYPAVGRMLPRQAVVEPIAEDRIGRGELFDSVLGALSLLAQANPVLLAVEDVHWADQATRDLLGFLFTRLAGEPLSIVLSYRSDDLHRRHPLRPTLAEWSRLSVVQRLHLGPLPDDDVRELVGAIGSRPLPESDLSSIVRRADGNAFFAEELVTAAEDECCDTQQLPWALADLMLVRLDRLSENAREVVRVAAVGGRWVSATLLEAVVDLPSSVLHSALREAVEAHVLELTSTGRDYAFRHALVAEAVYDDLLPGERVRIHSAYAELLAKRDEGSAAELARHARASHDLATAYEASIRAGDEAMAIAAPKEAMQHYVTALELAPLASSAGGDPAPLVVASVDAAVAAGHPYKGLKLARSSLAALPADAAPQTRARMLMALALAGVAGETDDETMAATAEALRLLPADPDSRLRARVAALHAHVCFILGREVEAERWARDAIDMAQAAGCREAAADANTTLAMIERRAGNPDEAARLLSALADEAAGIGDIESELRNRYSLGNLYYELADMDRALAAFETADQRARATGRQWSAHGVNSRLMAALVRFVTGDWDGALRATELRGEPPVDPAAHLQATAMRVRAARGDSGALDLLEDVRPLWERASRVALYSAQAALELYQQQGRYQEAIALIDDVVGVVEPLWQDPWFLARIEFAAQAMAALSTAVITVPEARRAELVAAGAALLDDGRMSAEKGLPRGRKMGVEGVAWLARLEAEWARLRWLAGRDAPDADELVGLWQQSVNAFGYGDVYELARSRARLAAVLRASGRGPEAGEQAALARDVARSLGAQPLLDEIRALGLTAGPRKSDSAAGLEALTSRERDVLELVVAGRTNRQIATQLYISEKTVSVHVSNILAKLGVRSRTEAAAVARSGS